MSDALRTLDGFEILRDLAPEELTSLLRHLTPVEYARGEYLFRQGDPGDAMYFLCDGIVVAECLVDPAGDSQKDVAILPANSVVGDMALGDDEPRSASVRAEIPVHAYRLSREAFHELQTTAPGIALKLFRTLFVEASRRLRATNQQLVAVYDIGRYVACAAEPGTVADGVVRNVARRLGASGAFVALYDREANGLRIAHAFGPKSDALLGQVLPLSDGGLVAQSYDDKRPILIERLIGATDPWESSSMLLAPLVVRDAARGILVVGEPESGGSHDLGSLSLLAAVANISATILTEAFS